MVQLQTSSQPSVLAPVSPVPILGNTSLYASGFQMRFPEPGDPACCIRRPASSQASLFPSPCRISCWTLCSILLIILPRLLVQCLLHTQARFGQRPFLPKLGRLTKYHENEAEAYRQMATRNQCRILCLHLSCGQSMFPLEELESGILCSFSWAVPELECVRAWSK